MEQSEHHFDQPVWSGDRRHVLGPDCWCDPHIKGNQIWHRVEENRDKVWAEPTITTPRSPSG